MIFGKIRPILDVFYDFPMSFAKMIQEKGKIIVAVIRFSLIKADSG